MCDFNIPRLRFGDQRSTLVDKQHVELGPKNFLLIPMNIDSFEKSMYEDAFLTLCNQFKG